MEARGTDSLTHVRYQCWVLENTVQNIRIP